MFVKAGYLKYLNFQPKKIIAEVAELRKALLYILNCCLPALENAIKDEIPPETGIRFQASRGSLMIHITLGQQSRVMPSDLFRMIEDGSLLQRLEAATFTEEFRQSLTDVSKIEIESYTQRQQLTTLLDNLTAGLSLRLSVELQQAMDLLFSPQCQTITLTLSPMTYRSPAVSVSDVFDEVFPVLSEILVKPRSQSLVSLENGM